MRHLLIPLLVLIPYLCGLAVGWIKAKSPYHRITSTCEAELPRNQKCVLIAVPEEKE